MNPKRIWITGASSGIGRATALELARRGHRVLASARSVDKLEVLAREAAGFDGGIEPAPLDVTDGGAAKRVHQRIEREGGPLDVAVLAAGTHQPVEARAFTALSTVAWNAGGGSIT